jgi:hypothetical protein
VAFFIERGYVRALSTLSSSFPSLGILVQDPDHFQIEGALILPGTVFEVLFQVGREPHGVPCIFVFHTPYLKKGGCGGLKPIAQVRRR